MDVAKLLGIIIGAALLAFGLGKAIPVLTLVGFFTLAGSMLWIVSTAYGSATRQDPRIKA